MKRISILLLVFCTCFALAAWPQAQPQWWHHKIITFDAPGAGTGSGEGTIPWGIVIGGWIQGDYIDSNGVYHGFLRSPHGHFTTFDVPGMGKGAGQGAVHVMGMNQELLIVGAYLDSNNAYHGFLRTPHGKFTTFECPGAGAGGTDAGAVNSDGLISAMYLDSNGAWHGCVRRRDGSYIEYDPAGSGTGAGQGTNAGIFDTVTPEGAIVSEYLDDNNMWHGYLRASDGTITEFNDPHAGPNGTLTDGINPKGEIWGVYIDANNLFHGFLRSPDGKFTEVDVPGAGTGTYQGTNACWYIYCYGGITPDGTVTGFYADSNSVYHGFLRSPRGHFTKFDANGAGTGTWQGTLPAAINPEGAIAGSYIDSNGVNHGFLRMP